MPLFLLILGLIAFFALLALALPFSIIGRYRAGTARRRARSWIAVTNAISIGISALIFLAAAFVSSIWIPGAFSYGAAGLAGGIVLGIAGLRLTRWESTPGTLYYTPNRWLVLALTVGVILRLAFGFWRAWEAWHASSSAGHSWLADSGMAGSMATGAIVLGYYFTFWTGVWSRVR